MIALPSERLRRRPWCVACRRECAVTTGPARTRDGRVRAWVGVRGTPSPDNDGPPAVNIHQRLRRCGDMPTCQDQVRCGFPTGQCRFLSSPAGCGPPVRHAGLTDTLPGRPSLYIKSTTEYTAKTLCTACSTWTRLSCGPDSPLTIKRGVCVAWQVPHFVPAPTSAVPTCRCQRHVPSSGSTDKGAAVLCYDTFSHFILLLGFKQVGPASTRPSTP